MASIQAKLATRSRELNKLMVALAKGERPTAEWAPLVESYRKQFILAPVLWNTHQGGINGSWTTVQFHVDTICDVPDEIGGVYGISIRPTVPHPPSGDYLIYVGKADDQSLRTRYKQHLNKLSETNRSQPRLRQWLHLWEDYLYFSFLELDDKDITDAENDLLTVHMPPCNIQYPAGMKSLRDTVV